VTEDERQEICDRNVLFVTCRCRLASWDRAASISFWAVAILAS
jgi:hypothetical protein